MNATARPLASLSGLSLRPAKDAPKSLKGGDITGRIASPVVAPEEPLPVRAPEPQSVSVPRAAANEPPPRAEEIVVYWERLRRGRPVPPIAELDRALVGNAWPGSLIVLFERDAAMPRISRLGTTDGAIEFTPMVTDWIMSSARQAAKRATKHDEVQSFPLEGASARYRLYLLPLATGNATTEGVLCHLCLA
ncbi:MAG TPA: hypothetical protein VLV50_13625 [Stellaceae bacterium]|nr:hypothetical protein [Stellaceae bacterium]